MSPTDPIPFTSQTALLLIDNQLGFLHPTAWGSSRSNPSYESNLPALISAFRSAPTSSPSLHKRNNKPEVIHIQHLSKHPGLPLHPDYVGKKGDGFEGRKGIEFLDFAKPEDGEMVITKEVNSAFIGTELERVIRGKGIKVLVVCGLTTDHCVSTTTRMAANLGVVDGAEEKGRIIFVTDATATFARGCFDAETVHAVNAATLDGEFAEVLTTEEVLLALEKGKELI